MSWFGYEVETSNFRGESHESKIFLNDNWGKLIIDMFENIRGLQGHCLAQIIVDEDCKLHLIEINPRLGGASPFRWKLV